LNHKGFGI